MKQEDIIKMAHEAGLPMLTADWLEAAEYFAKLVAQAEREAIVELVEAYGGRTHLRRAIEFRGEV